MNCEKFRALVVGRNSYFRCWYALFDMDGKQIPQELISKLGGAFEGMLKEESLLMFIKNAIIGEVVH